MCEALVSIPSPERKGALGRGHASQDVNNVKWPASKIVWEGVVIDEHNLGIFGKHRKGPGKLSGLLAGLHPLMHGAVGPVMGQWETSDGV